MTPFPSTLPWFDAHLDLAYLALSGRDMLADPENAGGGHLPACVTLPALRAGNVRWALGTIFTELGAPQHPYGYKDANDIQGARQAGVRQLEIYQQWEKEGLIRIIRQADELDLSPGDDAPIQIILLMECADPIADEDDAGWWHEQGVRVVGLAWTHACRYAMGNGVASSQGGLTDAGRRLVRRLDELGIVHDLTHLNDAAASELLSLSRGHVVATHSASRKLQRSARVAVAGVDPAVVEQRHIPPEWLAGVRAHDGMVGLPLYSRFLCEDQSRRPTLERVIEHLEELALHLDGRSRVGIGSDFDGGFSALQTPEGLEGPQHLHQLAIALRKQGWTDAEIHDVACENWLRHFKRVLM